MPCEWIIAPVSSKSTARELVFPDPARPRISCLPLLIMKNSGMVDAESDCRSGIDAGFRGRFHLREVSAGRLFRHRRRRGGGLGRGRAVGSGSARASLHVAPARAPRRFGRRQVRLSCPTALRRPPSEIRWLASNCLNASTHYREEQDKYDQAFQEAQETAAA
jgi:hypothetical protein